ncbi:MAG: beta-Ala-His dipeptidase [Lachnospiraceae bacterium]|nr:beta-Ala-His dipeptidase [Lachnospiraceae bacterium]
MGEIGELEPKSIFKYFEEISAIPRPSRQTKALSDYLLQFAEDHEFNAKRDEAGNVMIFVPATSERENFPTVMLHSHMDMECARSNDSHHDFSKDPLRLSCIDDTIIARGTTMGAESGIGIAYCLALISDKRLPHPPLEVVFTADEKVGRLGVAALDMSIFKARYLINLNGHKEGTFLVSAAGSLIGTITAPVKYRQSTGEAYKIVVSGFHGGHSGRDIDKYYGNANIIMGRLLHFLGDRLPFEIISLQGGLMRNAIPRDADCQVLIPSDYTSSFEGLIQEFEATIRNEYRANENNIMIYCDFLGRQERQVLYQKTQERVIFLLNTVPDGVQKVSQEQATRGIPETSVNFGIMRIDEKEFTLEATVRSSISSAKYALSDKLRYLSETIGGHYSESADWPAWEYREDSVLTHILSEVYKNKTGKKASLWGMHEGSECSVFFQKIPGIDIISMGPDIQNVNTLTEQLSVLSAGTIYPVLRETLKRIKE